MKAPEFVLVLDLLNHASDIASARFSFGGVAVHRFLAKVDGK